MSGIRFIDAKGKPFTIFISALLSLGCLLLASMIGQAIFTVPQALTCGGFLMLFAIPVHIFGKKHSILYVFSFGMNAFANGFSLSALYLHKGIEPELFSMLLSAVPAAVILLLTYLMLQFWHKTKKLTLTVATVINSIALAFALMLWYVGAGFFPFFTLLLSLFSLGVFGISLDRECRDVLKDISYGSFGSFVIVTLIVLVLITEGDILDGADFDLDLGGKKKKGPREPL